MSTASDGAGGDGPATARLSPTSFVVLGLIGLRGPSTPYELKRAVGRSVGYFWPFPHSQLYGEPDRLVRAGLLAVEQEGAGRRRKTYSITPAGREAVREWLAEPAGEPFQLRNIAELKLFFAELGEPANVHQLAREQVLLHEQRLAELDAIDARFPDADATGLGHRLVPLRLGRELERTALEFWRGIAASDGPAPEELRPARPAPPRRSRS
jgi:DNA-binding PadR family transcriptional regulator